MEAIAKERDALRQEVTQLRKSLEGIQSKRQAGDVDNVAELHSSHEEEIKALKEELDEANEGKDHFETQYKNLLGRVNTIKTSLGDRLKADAVCARVVCSSRLHQVCRYSPLTGYRPESRNSNNKFRIWKSKLANFKKTTIR